MWRKKKRELKPGEILCPDCRARNKDWRDHCWRCGAEFYDDPNRRFAGDGR